MPLSIARRRALLDRADILAALDAARPFVVTIAVAVLAAALAVVSPAAIAVRLNAVAIVFGMAVPSALIAPDIAVAAVG